MTDSSLLREEMLELVLFDMHEFPMDGAKPVVGCVDKEDIDSRFMSEAKRIIGE